MQSTSFFVIPEQAGIPGCSAKKGYGAPHEIPACAGMTILETAETAETLIY